jgi:hypothetical protein
MLGTNTVGALAPFCFTAHMKKRTGESRKHHDIKGTIK